MPARGKIKLRSSSRQGEEEGEERQGRAKEELVEGGGGEGEEGDYLGLTDWHFIIL